MIFKYFINIETGDCYEYEVSYKKVCDALSEIMSSQFDITKDSARRIIISLDLYDELTEDYKEELEDYFADEATKKRLEEIENN